MNKITKVFFDMDGVLVDLDTALETIERRSIRSIHEELKLIDKSLDPIIHLIKKHIQLEPFIHAPVRHDFDVAMKLIHTLIKNNVEVEILSSSTKQEKESPEIERQKRIWLTNNGLDFIKHNFALGATKKALWATPATLIIDDNLGTIEKFRKLGSSGIYHKSFEQTIKELELYLPFVSDIITVDKKVPVV